MALKQGSKMAKKAGRRAGLSALSVGELQRELRRRQGAVGRLVRRRDRLAAKLADLDSQIGELGVSVRGRGAGSSGGRVRPKNEMKLVDALVKVLTGKTMSVTEVAEAVQEAGYRTSSSSFRTIVNQTLINSGKFKRVGRGQYTAK
jgi:hypothetical protein